ncbi:MAG: hypothetical protein PHF51_05605 [Candidatus ainarchaeum sp.]|nr:hypothetical protein [Candidatus ainarchaeum sp.]
MPIVRLKPEQKETKPIAGGEWNPAVIHVDVPGGRKEKYQVSRLKPKEAPDGARFRTEIRNGNATARFSPDLSVVHLAYRNWDEALELTLKGESTEMRAGSGYRGLNATVTENPAGEREVRASALFGTAIRVKVGKDGKEEWASGSRGNALHRELLEWAIREFEREKGASAAKLGELARITGSPDFRECAEQTRA